MAPCKVIIDTDPGCDDVLAMLLAFSALSEQLQVLMISVTYGNVDVGSCLKNVVSLFHHIEQELDWRRQTGRPLGFESLRKHKPIVAAGADRPLAEQQVMADFFHGRDGLGDINVSHPHLDPKETFQEILDHAAQSRRPSEVKAMSQLAGKDRLFVPSDRRAPEEILRLLEENESGTITIVAIGPLTNVAIAAATNPTIFLRVKEVVVMGGAVHVPGNITPLAEFNTFADSIAAARVYALSSPEPASTMPPVLASKDAVDSTSHFLPPYPTELPARLQAILFPLDITEQHLLMKKEFNTIAEPLVLEGSPLAIWVTAWMESTYRKIKSLHPETGSDLGLQLHDPLTIWYCMSAAEKGWLISRNEDIRVETTGQWTRGACVTDGRSRRKREDWDTAEQPGDHGEWLRGGAGNRLGRCLESPGKDMFGKVMLSYIFQPGDAR